VLEALPPRQYRHDIVKVKFMEGKPSCQMYDVKDLKLI
jgi:hypothetical protein